MSAKSETRKARVARSKLYCFKFNPDRGIRNPSVVLTHRGVPYDEYFGLVLIKPVRRDTGR